MLDHGMLNVPLSKRGDIDAQIDRCKADQQKVLKQASREAAARRDADRKEAKALVQALPADKLERIAAGSRLTPKQTKKHLMSVAHWQPVSIIRALTK